jgi:hypothetical protein
MLMKKLPSLLALFTNLMGLACSGSGADSEPAGAAAEGANNPDAPDRFFVTLAGEALTTPSAVLGLRFFSDGEVDVELVFQVGDAMPRTSLVLQPSFDQLEQGTFEAVLVDSPLAKGNGAWFVSGKPISPGTVTVKLEPHGMLSGRTLGATPEMEFSGRFGLSCSVPQASLSGGRGLTTVPSGESSGEALVTDSQLVSAQCAQASQMLDWP